VGSSRSKHPLEAEPRAAYFKNSPTWRHFLMLKSDTTLFLKKLLWYPKLELVLFHTTEGIAFNYCKIQAMERPENTKEKSPLVFRLPLNCLWTTYETSFNPLHITFEPPMNLSLWAFELLINMHGFCCYPAWHYPERAWELMQKSALHLGGCALHIIGN
jgi:hypothetical protein